MVIDIFDLKERAAELTSKRDKAQGALETVKGRLKDLGCDSIEEANDKIAKLEQDIEKTAASLDTLGKELEQQITELEEQVQ